MWKQEAMLGHIIPVLTVLFSGLLWAGAQNVAHMPPKLRYPSRQPELFVSLGQNVALFCRADGIPAVVYEWFRNDNPIQSNFITFNNLSGDLQIKQITEREEGFFNCRAKNVYQGQEALAVSPKIEVRLARIGNFPPTTSTPQYNFTEGGYAKVPCDERLPENYGPTAFEWIKPAGQNFDRVEPDERIFIDQEGNLHFSYITKDDQNIAGNRDYRCAMYNIITETIRLGQERKVFVSSASGGIPENAPSLAYSTQGDLLTVKRGNNAMLECFFSGYENASRKAPSVSWYNYENLRLTSGRRYQLKSDGRVLIIISVMESDENVYTCEGSNGLGSTKGRVHLNVTSPPIWVEPLQSTTAVQGQNAELRCLARSAASEMPPGQPVWYKNGNEMGNEIDPTKYLWSEEKTKLTVTNVQKNRDIACFQCSVQNSVGTEDSQGCLNVILPITMTVEPERLQQLITKGDFVNFSVIVESDPLTHIIDRWWIFKESEVAPEVGNPPPYVTYDAVTMEAYINTFLLTDEEFAYIGGVYRREMYNEYQSVFVDFNITVVTVAEVNSTVVKVNTTAEKVNTTAVTVNTTAVTVNTTAVTVTKEAPAGEDNQGYVISTEIIVAAVLVPVVVILLVIIGCFVYIKVYKKRGNALLSQPPWHMRMDEV